MKLTFTHSCIHSLTHKLTCTHPLTYTHSLTYLYTHSHTRTLTHSPADVNEDETLNTLKYANRAKNIKNKVWLVFTLLGYVTYFVWNNLVFVFIVD